MRKMKKINGFLVVRFNDREKRVYPELGSFGVIDAEQYVGDIYLDLDAMEYTDAETIEIAVEQARGLNAEEDYTDQPTTYAVITETATTSREEEVTPKTLALAWAEQLKTQIKSRNYPDIDPRTAAHEMNGYKAALHHLGLLDADDAVTEPDTFGEACQFYGTEGHWAEIALPLSAGPVVVSPHDYEEGETFTGCTVQTLKCRRCGMESFAWSKGLAPEQEEALAYICDEVCKYREGRTQEELDTICARCKVDRWAGAPPTLTHQSGARATERDTFENLDPDTKNEPMTRKIYSLGLALTEECPGNDCKVYLNIFNMARDLDAALDKFNASKYPAQVLRCDLRQQLTALRRMYLENYAVRQFKEGMQK